ncbi:MAG: fibronectin type III domain-containing protein, partial [bacterium]
MNTAYNYRVRALNAGGNSIYSNVASATTLPNPPAAPSNLTATTVSNNRINLAWQDNANNELGFIIRRKAGAGGTYAVIDTVGANVKNYASLGLAGSTEYFYQVRAYNAGGNSDFSNEANATTKIDPPAAPSNLTATAVSNRQINLTWTDNASNETGFKIERKTGAAGTYAQIATVGANTVSYSSKGLTANTQYFYRVRAFNLTGNSSYSNEANATTLPDPPMAPSGLQAAAVSNAQINLTWTDNAANEVGFKIERKLSSAATYTQIAVVGANVTAYLSMGLSPNTAYLYRVRAYNADGPSLFSNIADATTLPSSPAAPGALIATTISKNQIDLAWSDNSNNEDGFKIERKLNAAVTYTEIATVGANATSYSSMGLNGNTAYSYRIRAYNTGGSSGYSNIANATTLPNPPNAPSGLSATAVSNTKINLAWQDNTGNELGFIIERKTGAGGTYVVIDTVGANVTIYSSLGLAASTEYFYQVRAYNAGGNSAYSNAANATTLNDPPAAPGSLTATAVSNNKINLAWADNASNENGFKIELKIGPSGTYAEIATVGANVTNYANTGLEVSTQYFYRVRAFNLTGNSSYSNEANATTLPNPPETPSDLQAAAVSKNQIDLAWTDNASNEAGFKIERKLSTAATYTQIATVGANIMSYSNTGLTPNTAYSYRIRSFNASGNSAYPNAAGATTLPSSPAGPSGLTATTVSSTQINLSWLDNAGNELGFIIRRKTGAGGAYAVIDSVGANVTAYSNLGLSANTKYFYQVRTYNAGGNSALSNEANATTSADPLATPSNLTAAAVNSGKINLTWTDNANNETGFKIERKLGAAGTYAQIATVGANVTSYSNTGLSANTTYHYRVRAYKVDSHSAYSNEANATTLPKSPKAPGNLTAAAVSKNQINLVWADSANNEAGFKIERKASPAGTFGQIATVGPNVTSYSNTGLTAGKTYYYRVRAYNAGGHSAYSNETNATTLPSLPKAPVNLTATAVSKHQINLVWADSANNETGFKIERKASAGGAFGQIATVGPNVTSYLNTGLTAGKTYYYRVRAYNASGHSTYSNQTNTTTLPALPKAPGNLIASTVSSSQIDLTWADSSNNEGGFKIERKAGAAGTYAEIDSVGAGVTNYSNTGLTAGVTYFYRIRAFNASGNSAYSNVANATTPGAAKSVSNDGDAANDATIPATISLAPNYPNPFAGEARTRLAGNPGTMISFTLPAVGKVTLQVYSETGQLVRTLVEGDLRPGRHQVRWNGRNQAGQAAAAGVYLYR